MGSLDCEPGPPVLIRRASQIAPSGRCSRPILNSEMVKGFPYPEYEMVTEQEEPIGIYEGAYIKKTMPRERDEESGKYTDAYTDQEFLTALEEEGGLAGTSALAEAVGCSSRNALNRLRELEEAGQITSKDVGRSLVWVLDDED